MIVGYELWSVASGNLLYDFDTEDEALAAIRELIVLNGPGTTDELALVSVSDAATTTVALGPALETYAQQAPKAGSTPPRRVSRVVGAPSAPSGTPFPPRGV